VGCIARRLPFRAARRRLARRRTHRVVREVHSRCRDAADVRRALSAGTGDGGGNRYRCGSRSRPRWTLLRGGAHHAALPRCVLCAADLRLAQLWRVGRGGREDRDGARGDRVARDARRVSTASARGGRAGRARGFRRTAATRGRRAPRRGGTGPAARAPQRICSTTLPSTCPASTRSCALAASASGYSAAMGTCSLAARIAWLSRSNSSRPAIAS